MTDKVAEGMPAVISAILRVTLEPRVERGAVLLDDKVPGWADEVDLNVLELANACKCILGQLADTIVAALSMGASVPRASGRYNSAGEALFGDAWWPSDVAADHGFELASIVAGGYDALDELWIEAIQARRTGTIT